VRIKSTATALLFWTLALVGCEKAAAPVMQRPPAAVALAAATTGDVPVYLDGVGKITAREMVSIQPQVSGRITAIHFADGADLRKGDALFTIDPRPFQAQLDAAAGNLAQSEAALAFARIQLERGQQLIESLSISQQEYDTRKNSLDVAEAQVQQGRAAVENANLNLQYCSIASPIDGRAGRRLVDIGNVVTANSGSLLIIQRLDPIYADFTVTENDLTAVQKSMRRGTLDVEVRLPDEPDTPLAGALTFLDNAIQDGTGNVTLRATIPNGDHRLWPGRFVKVRLVLSIQPGAVMVPAVAPQMSARGQFVYVVAPDATAELRLVKTGQRQGDFVVVEQGLKAGERVVVNGQLGVTPGGKVREDGSVTAGTTPAPATAGATPAPTAAGATPAPSAAPARSTPARTAQTGERGES
jgi:multidrug efflux system membrane fusion protein